jgi:hypothetical protein
MKYLANKYPGSCVDCGVNVSAGSGRTWKTKGKWLVSHGGKCGEVKPSYKQVGGRCEDAPCCGCCGGGNDYMTGDQMFELTGY